jgi:hypothetical protein
MVVRGGSCFLVAVDAGSHGMLSSERVFCGHVRLHVESRTLEAIQCVTRPAIASIHALCKLTIVSISMTIHTLRMGDRPVEVGVAVT